jgi:hydroxyacylglutathione hydrolase
LTKTGKEADLIIKMLVVGPIQANCYIVGCEKTGEAAIVDPGDEADRIVQVLNENKLTAKYIIDTHGHFDHVGANKQVKEMTGGLIVIHPKDTHMLSELSRAAATWGMNVENSPAPDLEVNEGDVITVGTIEFKVLHTPGHTPGGISLYTDNIVLVGDTLFAGSIGRTDFPGGDYQALISNVREKLFPLGDDVQVLSGHGPVTTIGRERQHNPFF